jgi:hypothetical protein
LSFFEKYRYLDCNSSAVEVSSALSEFSVSSGGEVSKEYSGISVAFGVDVEFGLEHPDKTNTEIQAIITAFRTFHFLSG